MKLNKTLLIATAIAGIVASVIDLLLYNALSGVWAQPALIALMLAILAVLAAATVFVTATVTDQSDEAFFFLSGRGPLLIALAVVLVVLFLLSMGLEWIYDSTKTVFSTPTSYIFVLDESGSMSSNDPDKERYKAVNAVMDTLPAETPYAVYMFGSEVRCVRTMAPYSQGAFLLETLGGQNLGGSTSTLLALQTVLNDYRAGNFSTGGAYPRVVLLSDGFASDMGLFSSGQILRDYRANGVSISTVGLGHVDTALMNQIASKTGGVYVSSVKATDLAQSFSTAATTGSDRDLFSQRDLVSSEFLYAVLRVLFLTVLGALIAVMKAAALAREDSSLLVIIEGAIASFVGALAVELLTLFGVSAAIGLAIYCLCVAVTPAWLPVVHGQYRNEQLYTGL